MTRPPQRPDDDFDPFASPFGVRRHWVRERREKIIQEIQANRRGEYAVPTWALGAALVLMIAVICTVLALA